MSTKQRIIHWSGVNESLTYVRDLEATGRIDIEAISHLDLSPEFNELASWGVTVEDELGVFAVACAIGGSYLSFYPLLSQLQRSSPFVSADEIGILARLLDEVFVAFMSQLEPYIPDAVATNPSYMTKVERRPVDSLSLNWSAGRISEAEQTHAKAYWRREKELNPANYRTLLARHERLQEIIGPLFENDPLFIFAQFAVPILMERTIRRYSLSAIIESDVVYLFYEAVLLNRYSIGLALPEPAKRLII